MSFFAGNGKLHITQNARTIEELNTNTVYPDTTFHSDMNVICSQGEYIAQSYLANFNVRHGDFPTSIVIPEQCYEVEIPQAVVNALYNNQVVLVQINTGAAESPINFPLNIKTGISGILGSNREDRAVAIAPQVTVGGRFDICFSQTSIKNTNISPTLSSIGESGQYSETTGKHEPTTYVMPWTTNPDYPSQYPNIMRAGARYAQIHFLGERWRLENQTPGNTEGIRRDNPSIVALTQVAPKFVFIVLNVRFTNYKFTTINPFESTGHSNILLQGGKISINGKDLTSIKILQAKNPEAKGEFILGSSINRVLANVTYGNISQVKTDLLYYKKYDSFIFSQGARYTNGVPLLRSTPGGVYPSYNYSLTDNSTKVYNDALYKYTPITAGIYDAYQTMGAPLNGVPRQNFPNIYYTNIKNTLITPEFGHSVGVASAPTPFALLDTTAFSGLYIDKDGIKGDYKGKMIPIYNNLTAPTYLIELTKNSYTPTFTMVEEGVLEFEQDLVDIVSTRNQESLLVGVSITGGTLFLNYSYWPGYTVGTGSTRISSSDIGCPVWSDPSSAVFGLIKLTTGAEVLLAHGYTNASVKAYDAMGYQNGPVYASSNCAVSAYVTISLKKAGSTLKIITRAVTEVGKLGYSSSGAPGYSGFQFKWLNAPQVNVALTKLQS